MEEKVKKGRFLDYIELYYAIATIQVVFVHSRLMRMKNPVWISRTIDYVNDYHMALFFFIAGFLLSYTEQKHGSLWKWYKRKLVKLLFPFLILTMVAFVPKVLLEPLLNNGATVSCDYILKVFFYPRKTIWGHLWFIPVYLFVLPICFCLVKRTRKNGRFALWVMLIVSGVLNVYPIEIGWLGIKDICRYLFYMVFGLAVEPLMNSDPIITIFSDYKCFLIITALSVLTYRLSNDVLLTKKIHVLVMIAAVMSLSLTLANCRLTWFRAIGRHNLTIYLYSWPVQAVAEIALTQFFHLRPESVILIKLVLGFIVPLCFVRIVDISPLLKKSSVFLGI